ncbi:MAG TPA: glycosyltransferase family 4 protein [Vicinamibacteria bacterium]|nr:glycosyltransferase family 4 protein [Vicinamibacteria bacterium]
MRPRTVLVAATQVPFQRGGAEWHTAALHRELLARGFQSEVVRLPFQWNPRREAVRSALAWRMLDLSRAGPVEVDLLIATRFPSYVARHPHKVVWLFHQFRQAYDLHEAGIDGFPETPEGRALREHVVELDTRALRECRRVFTTSENNAARLRRFNGLEAEVLRLPLREPERWRCAGFEPFVLSVGRLETLKRVDLLVRAVAAGLPPPARVVVVGEGTQKNALVALADRLGVRDRVEFRGWVEEADVKDLYARCGGVYYAPWDEDYGLVTLEAFHSGKPVVTTTDAGGPLEFVRDGETGLVAAPEPEAVASALARLLARPAEARAMGAAGRASVQGISWDAVIAALTGSGR